MFSLDENMFCEDSTRFIDLVHEGRFASMKLKKDIYNRTGLTDIGILQYCYKIVHDMT